MARHSDVAMPKGHAAHRHGHRVTLRHVGIALYVLGAAILFYVALTYGRGFFARERARSAWAAQEARVAMAASSAALGAPSAVAPVHGAPVLRLWIPGIDLDEVVVEGVDNAQLHAGPGHLPGSVLPGDRGNSVISAHRDRHFHALDEVTVGDTVVTETPGRRTTWVITKRRVVGEDTPAIYATTDATLTLTTCWPVRYLGPAPDRLILTAKIATRQG